MMITSSNALAALYTGDARVLCCDRVLASAQ